MYKSEIAKVRFQRRGDRLSRCLLWLAGEVESKKYDRLYESSVGLGLTNTVKYHAQRLPHLHREEIEIESKLTYTTRLPKFADYQAVFDRFGFGDRVSAMILSQIYPIENYLTPEGKPHVIYRRGRNSGKATKRFKINSKFDW